MQKRVPCPYTNADSARSGHIWAKLELSESALAAAQEGMAHLKALGLLVGAEERRRQADLAHLDGATLRVLGVLQHLQRAVGHLPLQHTAAAPISTGIRMFSYPTRTTTSMHHGPLPDNEMHAVALH